MQFDQDVLDECRKTCDSINKAFSAVNLTFLDEEWGQIGHGTNTLTLEDRQYLHDLTQCVRECAAASGASSLLAGLDNEATDLCDVPCTIAQETEGSRPDLKDLLTRSLPDAATLEDGSLSQFLADESAKDGATRLQHFSARLDSQTVVTIDSSRRQLILLVGRYTKTGSIVGLAALRICS